MGNKNDQYENEKITKDEAENYAKSINAKYRCVSALDESSSSITELFETIGKELFLNQGRETSFYEDNIKIGKEETEEKNTEGEKKKKKRGCC